jgi:hypothetical protein
MSFGVKSQPAHSAGHSESVSVPLLRKRLSYSVLYAVDILFGAGVWALLRAYAVVPFWGALAIVTLVLLMMLGLSECKFYKRNRLRQKRGTPAPATHAK